MDEMTIGYKSTPSDTTESLEVRLRRWTMPVAISLIVPLALFFVVKPDWYYLQNGLDPFFYTAYVQNFSNAIHAAGTKHYFVSRWTIYMPQRVLYELFGNPKAAFLLFRLIGASTIVVAIQLLGQKLWRRWDAVALSIFVLLMPMTLRALFDDYSDSVAVPLGVLLIALVAIRPQSAAIAACAGGIAAAMAIANPFGITIVACLAPFWLARVPRKRWLAIVASGTAGGVLVLLFGLVFFRVRYGIANIYQPTLDYANESGTAIDLLKSPRLWWLGYRIWIYIPLLLLVAYHCLRRFASVPFNATERMIMNVCALQYAFQIWNQFSMHGDGLEISYYWAYMLPALILAFCIVLGRLAQRAHRLLLPLLALLAPIAVRLGGSPTPELFSTWIDAFIAVAAVFYLSRRFMASRPWFAPLATVAIVLGFQVGAPRPEPILANELRVQSAYELAYLGEESQGVDSFKAVTWFVQQMNTLPTPIVRSAAFWFNDPGGSRFAAMFLAHVSSHRINPDWPSTDATAPFPPGVVVATRQGGIPTWVIAGSQADVDAIAEQAQNVEPKLRLVLSKVAPNAARTAVKVLTTLPG